MSSYGSRPDLILNNHYEDCDNSADFNMNLADHLTNVMNNRTNQQRGRKMPRSAVIETVRPEFSPDDWIVDNKNNTEMVSKDALPTGVFDVSSVTEPPVLGELALRLHQCLRKSQDTVLGGRRILVPADMLPRLAQEVLRMAHSEPYGISGVLVNMYLEQGEEKVTLGKVESTSYVASTFVVNITLREDVSSRWKSFKELVLGGLLGRKALYLSPAYKIVKQKLYRSNSGASC